MKGGYLGGLIPRGKLSLVKGAWGAVIPKGGGIAAPVQKLSSSMQMVHRPKNAVKVDNKTQGAG